MAKRRNLGHISAHHAMKSAVVKFIDENDITGSAAEVTSAWEYRLDVIEDETSILHSRITNVSSSVDANTVKIYNLNSDLALTTSDIATNASGIADLDITVGNLSSDIVSNTEDIVNISDELLQVSSSVVTVSSDINEIDIEVDALSSSLDSVISNATLLSSSLDSVISDVTLLSSSLDVVTGDITYLDAEMFSLSSSLASLSSSFALLSASIGSGGNLNVSIPSDSELYFNGDTLMTDADVYISGSGNNLYLHGTNDQGMPAKFEFSIVDGGTIIQEVPHTDFGDEIDDPWFKFDGDTLLTHADIYVSGSNNYLYLNGTDENGDYGIFYFDIVEGRVIVKQTGSVN